MGRYRFGWGNLIILVCAMGHHGTKVSWISSDLCQDGPLISLTSPTSHRSKDLATLTELEAGRKMESWKTSSTTWLKNDGCSRMFQNVYRLNALNVLTSIQCCQAWFCKLCSLCSELAKLPETSNKFYEGLGRWTNRSHLGLQNCCQDSECLDGAPLQSVEWVKHRSKRGEQRGDVFLLRGSWWSGMVHWDTLSLLIFSADIIQTPRWRKRRKKMNLLWCLQTMKFGATFQICFMLICIATSTWMRGSGRQKQAAGF